MKRLSGPIDVQLELTENCNFRCRHCYNYWRYHTKNESCEFDVEQALEIIKILRGIGVSVVTLTGGEPLLRPHILFPVLEEAKRDGMEVGLNSNATLITPEIARHLKEANLDHALCSILGKEATHNSITGSKNGFSQTIKGIRNLVETGMVVVANMVVSKLNQNEVFEVGRIVNDLGVKTFCATPMVPSHESNRVLILNKIECKRALKTLLSVKEALGINIDTLEPIARCLFDEFEEDDFVFFFGNRICSAAITSCAISSSGMIRPCIHSDKSFGNVLKEDFSSIWDRMSSWANESMLPVECMTCEASPVCEGGCRMSSKILNGCYNGKDMYMSKPIKGKERVTKLPIQTGRQTNLTKREVVRFNPMARLRKEDFGGVAYVGTNVEFLTPEGFEIVQLMSKKKIFSLKEFAQESNLTEEDLGEILLKLLEGRIILKEERR